MTQRRAFLRTTTFRITLLAAGLFAVFVSIILAYVYSATAGAMARQDSRAIETQAEDMVRAYRRSGLNGLNRIVVERSVGASEDLYLLTRPNGQRISGNLSALPEDRPDDDSQFGFTYQYPTEDDETVERRAKGRMVRLLGGYQILVGRDVEENARYVRRVTDAIWTGSALVLAFGVLLGGFVSRRFAQRLDALNTVAREVTAGNLTARAPRNNSGDELDELSANLNEMLDRIERLTTGLRHAGDSIAHDLRSPLTRLRNRMEDSLREAERGADCQEALQQALDDADGLLNTFGSVLKIARLEAGERREQLSIIDPQQIVEDLAELYEPVAEDSGLSFTSDMEEGLTIRADRGLLSQALANLLDNAIKYAPEGEAIALRLRKSSDGRAEISVTDTGPGIPADARERVKKRFVRLDESRSAQGSGLGLSLVQAVADIHGAEFTLEDGPGSSTLEAPGLRAVLTFPRAR